MKPRYYYFDPLDVYQELADTYLPFDLVETRRHANGLHYGYFNITWDGHKLIHSVGVRATYFSFNTNFPPPGYSHDDHRRYWLRVNISRLASQMLRHFAHRTEHFHMAQNYIMSGVLYHYPVDYGGSGSGSSGCKEWRVSQEGGAILVEDHRGESQFTWHEVRTSIVDQLKHPQQLRMFA